MKKRVKTCFNCGEPAYAGIQSRSIKRLRFICRERACWETYWQDADKAREEALKAA